MCTGHSYGDRMHLGILLLLLVFLTGTLCAQYEDLMLLENNLFNGYSANLRPVNQSSETVMVDVELSVSKVVELDVSKEVMVTWLEFKVTWIDQRLQWDDLEYPGVRTINVPRSKVWVPDLHVLKSAHKDGKLEGNDNVQISPCGKIQWYGKIETKTWCSMYVTKFPFDDQKCAISISTLYHNEQDVNITAVTYTGDNEDTYSSWEIKSVRSKREKFRKENETRSGITLHFQLQRYSMYYLYSVFLPVVTVCFVNPFVFLVRAKSGEQISAAITLFLSFTMFISLLSGMVPQTSNSVPFLFLLVYVQFQNSAGIVIKCILRSRQDRCKLTTTKWYTKLFGCLTKAKKSKEVTCSENLETEHDGIPKQDNLDEQLLEDRQDRKTFISYFIMTLLFMVSAFLVLLI